MINFYIISIYSRVSLYVYFTLVIISVIYRRGILV